MFLQMLSILETVLIRFPYRLYIYEYARYNWWIPYLVMSCSLYISFTSLHLHVLIWTSFHEIIYYWPLLHFNLYKWVSCILIIVPVSCRSNFLGTKFTIYDAQPPHAGAMISRSHSTRGGGSEQISPKVLAGNYPVAHIAYELNVSGSR